MPSTRAYHSRAASKSATATPTWSMPSTNSAGTAFAPGCAPWAV
nr:hypothetical protein [Tsukamurella sp. PLM1]